MNKLNRYTLNIYSIISLFALLILVTPSDSLAQHEDFFSSHHDHNADIVDRLDHDNAVYSMTNREGSVDLLLTMNSVVIQFSDRFLDDLDDEIRREAEQEESVLAEVIVSMVSSGVKSLLNHAVEIPMSEVREIYYEDGKLYIMDYEGDEIFGEMELNDVYIMEDFSRRNARRFVSEAEKLMI